MKITKLKHKEIDLGAYNNCIESSHNGTVYAMSWYLDVVSPEWEILMAENYSYVMPLPRKSKFGYNYLTQPYFCQQLGLFSNQEITEIIFNEFIKAIPYKYANIQLNSGNVFNQDSKLLRPNFVLSLDNDYETIKSNYKSNCSRNLKKSLKTEQEITNDISIIEYLEFIKINAGNRPIIGLLNILESLLIKAKSENTLKLWMIKDSKSNELLAGVALLIWNNRAYYLVPASSENGKNNQSMTLAVDLFIQSNAHSNIVLDFEGSSLPGISRFYEGFGAIKQEYPVLMKNDLPNLIKKLSKLYYL